MPDFAGKGLTLSQTAVDAGINTLDIKPAAFWAVMTVETRGFGFLADKRPLILFERHIFHKQTGGMFSAANPDISNSKAGGYGAGGAHQYDRLAKAVKLDRQAALKSASWGLGQVMGFNAKTAGFSDVNSMVKEMADGENDQVKGMIAFISSQDLAKFLRNENWAEFARHYNGSDFKKNKYDVKLLQAFNLYSKHPTPDLEVRRCQAALLYLGFNPGGVDGVFGMGSQKALIAWQKSKNLPQDGKLSPAIIAQLTSDAGI